MTESSPVQLPRVLRPPPLGGNLSSPSSSSPPPLGGCAPKTEAGVTWRPVSAGLLVASQRVKAFSTVASASGLPGLRKRREGGRGRPSDAC